MRSSAVGLASAIVLGVLVVACANGQIDPIPTTDANKTLPGDGGIGKAGMGKDAGGSSRKPSQSDETPEEEDPSTTGSGQCAAETTFDACLDCCATAHETGATTFYGTYINCLCLSQNCQTECSTTLCDPLQPTQPNTTCNTCIQANSASCQAPVQSACAADPDCIAFDKCVGDSQCESKP